MKLKVRIVACKENYEKYKKKLESAGFIISNDSDLVFKEKNYHQDTFIGSIKGKYEIIHFSKVIYFESFGHNIIMKTLDKEYTVKEKLYELEELLSDKSFIRVNKSQIVSKYGIQEIIPSLNSRINLKMKNGDMIYVSRNYSQRFKERIGF